MKSRLTDIAQLTKMRLSLLVVFSAAMAFLIGSSGDVDVVKLILLVIGGVLVTGSANAFNQIMEKDLDRLMNRTRERPLPDQRMKPHYAFALALVIGVAGLVILFFYLNSMAGFLGLAALISYTVMYTPLKRITPFAVFVGAFPGAIPVLLGYVAATQRLDQTAWLLFAIQFFWQFPHFWAIAWVMDEDYKKAGFELLPSASGRSPSSAFYTLLYTIILLPIGLLPFFFGISGVLSMIIILLATLIFIIQAVRLLRHCDLQSARHLMFGSFVYLPVVLLALVVDKT